MTYFTFTHGLDGVIDDETGKVYLDVQPLLVNHVQRLSMAEIVLGFVENGSEGMGGDFLAEVKEQRIAKDAQTDFLSALMESVIHTEAAGVNLMAGLDPHAEVSEAFDAMDRQDADMAAFVQALEDVKPDDFK